MTTRFGPILTLALAAAIVIGVGELLGQPLQSPEIRVITGVDANHTAVTKPLVEIIPEPGDRAATVNVAFLDVDPNYLGLEGSLVFLMAKDAAHAPVLDRLVDTGGDQQRLDSGDYHFVAYFRTCDGNCSLLDAADEFCTIDATLASEATYLLTVELDSCTLEVEPPPT